MVFMVILVFLGIIWLEVPGLWRQKMWRELTAFAGLLVLGLALSIPQALGMTIPSPNKFIEILFKPLVQWMTK